MAQIPTKRKRFIKPWSVALCATDQVLRRRWHETACQRTEAATQRWASDAVVESAVDQLALGYLQDVSARRRRISAVREAIVRSFAATASTRRLMRLSRSTSGDVSPTRASASS